MMFGFENYGSAEGYGSVYPPLVNAILSRSRENYRAIRDNYRVIRDN